MFTKTFMYDRKNKNVSLGPCESYVKKTIMSIFITTRNIVSGQLFCGTFCIVRDHV